METFKCSVPGGEQEEFAAIDFEDAAKDFAESENDYGESYVLKEGSIDVDVENEAGEVNHYTVEAEAQVLFYVKERQLNTEGIKA